MGAHTADCVVEAWAPDRVSCLAEAGAALVGVCADVAGVPATGAVPVSIGPAADDELLVALLEETIFVMDGLGAVPVRFVLSGTDEGGVTGTIETAPAGAVTRTGPVPKGVSYHGLRMQHRGGVWRCLAIVDV